MTKINGENKKDLFLVYVSIGEYGDNRTDCFIFSGVSKKEVIEKIKKKLVNLKKVLEKYMKEKNENKKKELGKKMRTLDIFDIIDTCYKIDIDGYLFQISEKEEGMNDIFNIAEVTIVKTVVH